MENHSAEDDTNDTNTTLLELQDAFATALRNTGVMGKLRAQLRAAAVSIIRGDLRLRTAAVGKTMVPSAISPEYCVALLLIEDFARFHGMYHTLGVFEAESNISLMNQAERDTAQPLLQQQGGTGELSALEKLIASGLAQQTNHQQEEEQQQPIMSTSTSLFTAPAIPSKLQENGKKQSQNQQQEEEIETQHPWIVSELDEYEDSVAYSVASIADMSCDNDMFYEFVEKF